MLSLCFSHPEKVKAWLTLSMLALATVANAQTTVVFQNGLNGYSGTLDKIIASDGIDGDTLLPDPNIERLGSEVQNYFLDGMSGSSPDRQALLRFDDLFGSGAGQVPLGATILDAQLTLTTSNESNSRTGGNYFAAGLTDSFTASTTYGDYTTGRGAWWEDATATKPIHGAGPTRAGTSASFDITTLAQQWSDGVTNNGVVVQAGRGGNTSDGWSVNSSSFYEAGQRPKLAITYTTAAEAEVNTFQQGVNGYSSNSMVRVTSGSIAAPSPSVDANPIIVDPINGDMPDDVSYDGLTINNGGYLDGASLAPYDSQGDPNPIGTVGSQDQFALIKFDNVFGAGAGQAPSDVPVGKAYVVLSTGSDPNHPTDEAFTIHPVYRDWNTSTLPLHSDFGDIAGLQESDGDIGPELDRIVSAITGYEAWLDVTDYLEGVRTGNPLGGADYGLAVTAKTSNGWEISWNGDDNVDVRPRLVVVSSPSSIVTPGLPGDFNDDGVVDLGDFAVWRDKLGSSNPLNGNGNENGASASVVDAADYALWKQNFGNTSSAGVAFGAANAAVPEPSTALLALLPLLAAGLLRRTMA